VEKMSIKTYKNTQKVKKSEKKRTKQGSIAFVDDEYH
jgi:hypothetical protein